MPLDGMPTSAQILTYTDSLAAVVKYLYSALGINASGDVSSSSYYSDLARKKILGDGGSNPGIGAPGWQSNVKGTLNSLAASTRWDVFFSSRMQGLASQLDSLVASYMPSGWKFSSTTSQAHAFDFLLTRMNANSSATPVTPTTTPALAAANSALGALPNVASGSAPRVVYTLVGALDHNESLPSPEATQVALTGSQNSYNVTISGTVPSGIYKVRVYRSVVGGATGAYQWDQDVAVSAGGTFSPITILRPDSKLRADVAPPAFLSCMMTPEFAAAFALAFGSSASTFNPTSAASTGVTLATNGLLTPINVALNPSNGLLGLGNPASSAVFGTSTVTGAGTQTYSAGTIQTSNNAAANVQGFAGSAGGLRARITSVLATGTCAVTISYTYLQASTGQTIQTATGVTSASFGSTAVDQVVTFSVAAGRLVLSATVTGVSGAATAGTIVIEAQPVRSL
jgi:hypothetical protein